MKKLNKKGFTLIELLAVIVVLAIIMVIAATQVGRAIETARTGSFEQSYKMIQKEIKNRILEKDVDVSQVIECDELSTTATEKCSAVYDISANDYYMYVEKDGDNYNLVFAPHIDASGDVGGKFANINMTNCVVSGACGHLNTNYTSNRVISVTIGGDSGNATANVINSMTTDNKSVLIKQDSNKSSFANGSKTN